MICKRIRLTERRMKPIPEIREGPIMRPCTTNLVNSTTAAPSPRIKRVTIRNPPPEDHIEVTRESLNSTPTLPPSNPPPKTPLIVLTLSMPPETETLVPKLVKRDPRKPPSFCVQYLTQAKLISDTKRLLEPPPFPEIYIQGVELVDPKPDDRDILTDRSISSKSTELQSMLNNPCDDQNAIDFFGDRDFLLNFDGYDLDINGGLPGDTRTPTPTSNGIRTWCVRRTPSPTTRQVIRVDVSLNKRRMQNKL